MSVRQDFLQADSQKSGGGHQLLCLKWPHWRTILPARPSFSAGVTPRGHCHADDHHKDSPMGPVRAGSGIDESQAGGGDPRPYCISGSLPQPDHPVRFGNNAPPSQML
jgi:hypothetical protein